MNPSMLATTHQKRVQNANNLEKAEVDFFFQNRGRYTFGEQVKPQQVRPLGVVFLLLE